MLLIDLSREIITLSTNWQQFFVDRKDVEDKFPQQLLEISQNYKFSDIYVIQGPASFSVIRIWVLMINAFVMFSQQKPKIFTLNKLDFYSYLQKKYADSILSQALFFIGQKKNVRHYDFSSSSFSKIQKTEVDATKNYITDCLDYEGRAKAEAEYVEPFVLNGDQISYSVSGLGWFSPLGENQPKQKSLTLRVSDFPWLESSLLQPLYVIEATVD